MKDRLRKIYWTGIFITMIMAISAIGAAALLQIDDTRNYLNAMLQAASRWTLDSNEDLQSLAESISASSSPMRVTFLMDTGVILADSDPNADLSEIHSNDKEIISAREGKIGSHLRLSRADAVFVLYAARRISPQLLLRLSYPVFEVFRIVLIYGSLILVLFLILYFIQRRMITRFAVDQQRQLDDVRRLLDDEISQVDAVFPEYQPSLDAISYRTRRLREDQEEIIRTMNLRNDFIANASHELRSPLTSIKGYAEMLEEGMADTPEEKDLCLSMIRTQSERMLSVINNILRLNKLENKSEAVDSPISAAPLASEVAQALAPLAAGKSISISVSGDTKIRGTEKDIWEILFNLTDNAIRYGREGGYVRIDMEPGRVEVSDNGIGIDPEHVGHIFEQFYRVDESRQNDASGTGLGLSIVRAIVENCGGTIRVESRYGVGTSFILEFPVEETL